MKPSVCVECTPSLGVFYLQQKWEQMVTGNPGSSGPARFPGSGAYQQRDKSGYSFGFCYSRSSCFLRIKSCPVKPF